jgi:hypothetical protein
LLGIDDNDDSMFNESVIKDSKALPELSLRASIKNIKDSCAGLLEKKFFKPPSKKKLELIEKAFIQTSKLENTVKNFDEIFEMGSIHRTSVQEISGRIKMIIQRRNHRKIQE